MHPDKPLKQSHLKVATDINAVAKIFAWFDRLALRQFPCQFCVDCKVALDEAFANAVHHAHRYLPHTTPIELELKIFADRLEMRIWDHGQPFDLQAKLDALHQKGCNLLEETGRGLILMEQFTDELSYQRLSDQRNCLFMGKRLVPVSH
ncbi:MAG: ATP-binding protein [Coleofasciculus sp. D1-CHI-01]|uniref:ATP-binding protein n=1 Tax=Coleofasciculus sp. D1-CHI-01 TaxID=3068482 RepID=UPI0032F53E1C